MFLKEIFDKYFDSDVDYEELKTLIKTRAYNREEAEEVLEILDKCEEYFHKDRK